MTSIELQLCDIQGRLFKLSTQRGITSADLTVTPEYPTKQGILGQKGVNQNYDKSLIHLPRQAKVGQFMSEVVGCCGANRCKPSHSLLPFDYG